MTDNVRRERDIQRAVQLACSRDETRLFRNNVGLGWTGRIVPRNGDMVIPATADVLILAHPRPLHAGLHVGSGDLIGWTRGHARCLNCGMPVLFGGRFVSLELKSARGRPSAAQRAWLEAVQRGGGLAAIVRSVEDAERVLRGE